MDVVVIGGGWSGCAAALEAGKQGAKVTLVERSDMLLGTGLVGGIMRNNARFTATEEMIAMGAKEIFYTVDSHLTHKNIDFPGHSHACLYNVSTVEPAFRALLLEKGICLKMNSRITDVTMAGTRIETVQGRMGRESFELSGDAFIDTTGTAGPPALCNKHGNGCAMCILRCHTFGGRVSVAAKAGVKEMIGTKPGQVGAMSGSCKLHMGSLSSELQDRLKKTGVAVVPVPGALQSRGKLALKACQQYASKDFAENVILLNTGHAKLMTPFFPLEMLRQIPGLETARFEDPYSGGMGNSIRFLAMSPRDDRLKVEGVDNLFCAGEKAGLLVGHTEAICTGTLAGFNAAQASAQERINLPQSLMVGDAISHVRTQMMEKGRLDQKFTFSGSVLFERLQQKNLYTTDIDVIRERVSAAGMAEVF
ncbi:MAG TPA: FAD-dependent oxidoreductase [Desulfobacteraceae bacterium]|nr:FAD-dependent oxidoreductase [Desulfobacteraceae bacterium]